MKRKTTMGTAAAAAIALMCAAMLAAGCSSTNKDPQMMSPNASVTDVSVAPTPLEAPAPIAQPVISDAPTQAPAPLAAAPAGGKYTVQKGDTLWKIASASYGNGNQWQRIANANPGLTPATLKAGQTIMIP